MRDGATVFIGYSYMLDYIDSFFKVFCAEWEANCFMDHIVINSHFMGCKNERRDVGGGNCRFPIHSEY